MVSYKNQLLFEVSPCTLLPPNPPSEKRPSSPLQFGQVGNSHGQSLERRAYHSEALRRRMIHWRSGDLLQLFKEAETIQKGLKDSTKPKSIGQLSKKFVEHMNKGNINSAIKLLSNNMENGILPLNDTTLKLLKQKHPRQSEADKHLLSDDIPKSIHKIKHECIDAEVIRNTALRTRGGSGPSGMDAYGWRRILTSNSFGQSSTDIYIALANVAKKICVQPDQTNSLEAFLASSYHHTLYSYH